MIKEVQSNLTCSIEGVGEGDYQSSFHGAMDQHDELRQVRKDEADPLAVLELQSSRQAVGASLDHQLHHCVVVTAARRTA